VCPETQVVDSSFGECWVLTVVDLFVFRVGFQKSACVSDAKIRVLGCRPTSRGTGVFVSHGELSEGSMLLTCVIGVTGCHRS
jgi:hypothetical protein